MLVATLFEEDRLGADAQSLVTALCQQQRLGHQTRLQTALHRGLKVTDDDRTTNGGLGRIAGLDHAPELGSLGDVLRQHGGLGRSHRLSVNCLRRRGMGGRDRGHSAEHVFGSEDRGVVVDVQGVQVHRRGHLHRLWRLGRVGLRDVLLRGGCDRRTVKAQVGEQLLTCIGAEADDVHEAPHLSLLGAHSRRVGFEVTELLELSFSDDAVEQITRFHKLVVLNHLVNLRQRRRGHFLRLGVGVHGLVLAVKRHELATKAEGRTHGASQPLGRTANAGLRTHHGEKLHLAVKRRGRNHRRQAGGPADVGAALVGRGRQTTEHSLRVTFRGARLHRGQVIHRLQIEQVPQNGSVIFGARQEQGGVRGAPGHRQNALLVALQRSQRQRGAGTQIPELNHGVLVVTTGSDQMQTLVRVPGDI
mmetsp:Transcript_61994/g.109088  ORF Transcript_61994/g.109088 Transcript_61994/m.109088 type:complete len:418 (+) Transcript_61994:1711-2964(+)